MSEADLFLDFVRRFEALQLEYIREGGSEKHLLDIAAMLRVSSELLDHDRLESWIARLGLEEQWELARAKAES